MKKQLVVLAVTAALGLGAIASSPAPNRSIEPIASQIGFTLGYMALGGDSPFAQAYSSFASGTYGAIGRSFGRMGTGTPTALRAGIRVGARVAFVGARFGFVGGPMGAAIGAGVGAA